MKRENTKRKAVLAIRQIVDGAKQLVAIEDALLKKAQGTHPNKSKLQRNEYIH